MLKQAEAERDVSVEVNESGHHRGEIKDSSSTVALSRDSGLSTEGSVRSEATSEGASNAHKVSLPPSLKTPSIEEDEDDHGGGMKEEGSEDGGSSYSDFLSGGKMEEEEEEAALQSARMLRRRQSLMVSVTIQITIHIFIKSQFHEFCL